MHFVIPLKVNERLEEYKEEIVGSWISKRRREITFHYPIVIVNKDRITKQLVTKSRGISHNSGNMSKEDSIQGRGTTIKTK